MLYDGGFLVGDSGQVMAPIADHNHTAERCGSGPPQKAKAGFERGDWKGAGKDQGGRPGKE